MNEASDTTIDMTPRWSSIVAGGPEAESFLQGQLSQDLTLVTSSGAWSLLLAPDGVVVTSLVVTPTPEGYELVVPRELGAAALSRLKRFLLRTRCELELRDVERGPFNSLDEQIDVGLPGPREFAAGLTPQTFGATFVRATVSFTKGCFTGQELVGRLDARGSSVPWRLVRVTGPNAERVNEVLTAKGPTGTSGLTTSATSGDVVRGLGIAHRSLLGSDELAHADDVVVEEIV